MRAFIPLLASSALLLTAACGASDDRTAQDAQVASSPTDPTQGEQVADDSASATPPAVAPVAPDQGLQGGSADWRTVARAADASLLGRLDQAWRLGRAEAEDAGFAAQVEALGPLVDPNAAQNGQLQPPPGAYRCRTIKLGRKVEGQGLAYVDYPPFRCTVELTPGGDLVLTKTTGSQRTRGLLYPDGERRLVYLGAQALGDETGFPDYGDRNERNQIGVLERVGPNRWRLALPWPRVEAKLELLELTR
ncbi:DUF4893 domain-containing protein [Brevundimonas sp. PAMC22021]|uniref:DUF4893 domain-containing protein n=1 Tax=Brevundimonas sp. PAMC22021 TaxID=2861285 RepID=UPI001C62AA9E|nr:DUF4893 domain-containing protein [Brevundimonas sp. PAMC22021]QYF86868.1 DUF4893 domain-containing protein [Brevundimonas sp. PAMC22021]